MIPQCVRQTLIQMEFEGSSHIASWLQSGPSVDDAHIWPCSWLMTHILPFWGPVLCLCPIVGALVGVSRVPTSLNLRSFPWSPCGEHYRPGTPCRGCCPGAALTQSSSIPAWLVRLTQTLTLVHSPLFYLIKSEDKMCCQIYARYHEVMISVTALTVSGHNNLHIC